MGIPRILIAACKSGSGKTLLSCGLLSAWKKTRSLAAFKCGPDYIDPMFHREILGIDSRNLDSFLCKEEQIKELFERHCAGKELAVLEGVMGYYDGLGGKDFKASTYDIARITDTPVILVVDSRGASRSLLPLIAGFRDYRKDSRIAGVIFNRMSPSFYPIMKRMVEEELDLPVYGYLEKMEGELPESRYLGLKMPGEYQDMQETLEALGRRVEATVDLEGLFSLAKEWNRERENGKKFPDEKLSREEVVFAEEMVSMQREHAEGEEVSVRGILSENRETVQKEQLPAEEMVSMQKEDAEGEEVSVGGILSENRETGEKEQLPEEEMVSMQKEDAEGEEVSVGGLLSEKRETVQREQISEEEMVSKGEEEPRENNIRIGVARDEAFCFIYGDNLEYLRELGVTPVYFSPIRDEELPENLDGVLFYGGYPELYSHKLEANESLRKEIKKRLSQGLPCMAECGGFMYLTESITDKEGSCRQMVGAVSGNSYFTGKLKRFGYALMEEAEAFGKTLHNLPFHEFHYFDSENPGEDCLATKPLSDRSYSCMVSRENLFVGYLHFQYRSKAGLAEAFVEACRSYHRKKGEKGMSQDGTLPEKS